MLQLTKLLEDQGESINMFKFIINPDDFAQSVENLFHLSFLIRDGTCAMELDEESQEPMICTLRKWRDVCLYLRSNIFSIRGMRTTEWWRLQHRATAETSICYGIRHGYLEGNDFLFYRVTRCWFFVALQRAIEVFEIRQPIIPQRPAYKADGSGRWYG